MPGPLPHAESYYSCFVIHRPTKGFQSVLPTLLRVLSPEIDGFRPILNVIETILSYVRKLVYCFVFWKRPFLSTKNFYGILNRTFWLNRMRSAPVLFNFNLSPHCSGAVSPNFRVTLNDQKAYFFGVNVKTMVKVC